MEWCLVKEGSGTSWRKSALFLVFVQLYRKESTSVEKKERVLAFSGEKDFSAQGFARGRRVCSFIGVGFPWPLRSPVYESSEKGILVCSRVFSGTEKWSRCRW